MEPNQIGQESKENLTTSTQPSNKKSLVMFILFVVVVLIILGSYYYFNKKVSIKDTTNMNTNQALNTDNTVKQLSSEDIEKSFKNQLPADFDLSVKEKQMVESLSKVSGVDVVSSGLSISKVSAGPAIIKILAFFNNSNKHPSELHQLRVMAYFPKIAIFNQPNTDTKIVFSHIFTKSGQDVLKDGANNTMNFISNTFQGKNGPIDYFSAPQKADFNGNLTAENLGSLEGTLVITISTNDNKIIKKEYPFVIK